MRTSNILGPDGRPAVIEATQKSFPNLDPFYPNPFLSYLANDTISQTTIHPYQNHSWVYTCAKAYARNLTSLPRWMAPKSDLVKFLPEHPIYEVWKDPNPFMNSAQLWEAIILNLLLPTTRSPGGQCFLILTGKNEGEKIDILRGEMPFQIWPYSDEVIKPRMVGNRFLGWSMQIAGEDIIDFEPHEVVRIRLYNPGNPLRGLAPYSPVRNSVELDAKAVQFDQKTLDNGGVLQGLLTTDQSMNVDTIKEMDSMWRQNFGGSKNAGKTAILANGLKYQELARPAAEMAFLESRKYARDEILAAYHVPKWEAGIYEDINFACLPASEHVFTESGPKSIAHVAPGEMVWSLGDNGPELHRIVNSWEQGVKNVYRVLAKGFEVRGSGDHPLLRAEGESLRWVRIDEINPGDWIVAASKLPCKDDETVSEDMAQFAGAFLGDGCLLRKKDGRAQYVSIGIPETYSGRATYIALAEKLFAYRRPFRDGRKLKVYQHKDFFSIGSRDACQTMVDLGLDKPSLEKRIPEWVFRSSREVILRFMRGYLDTDGSVSKDGRGTWSSSSPDLMKDLKRLCVLAGIQTSRINVCVQDVVFGEHEYHSTSYRLTCSKTAQVIEIGSEDFESQDRLSYALARKNESFDRSRSPSFLKTLPAGFRYVQVSEVESDGAEMVYDLEVEGRHNFIAEGVVVHNTAQMAEKHFWGVLKSFDKAIWLDLNDNWLRFLDKGKNLGVSDYSEVEALQSDYKDKIAMMKDLNGIGVPVARSAKLLRVPLELESWNDTVLVPSTQVDIQSLEDLNAAKIEQMKKPAAVPALPDSKPADPNADPAEEAKPEDPKAKTLEGSFADLGAMVRARRDTREAIWNEHVTKVFDPGEKAVRKEIEAYFVKQRNFLQDKVDAWRKRNEKTVPKTRDTDITPDDFLPSDKEAGDEDAKLKNIMGPLYDDMVTRAATKLSDELGGLVKWNAENPYTAKVKADRLAAIPEINTTTFKRASTVIAEVIDQGTTEHQTVQEIAKTLKSSIFDVYQVRINNSKTIARTETAIISSGTRASIMQVEGVPFQEWLSAHDENVRESHAEEDGNTVEVGGTFPVTGLHYPSDPEGAPEEIISCRCVALARKAP